MNNNKTKIGIVAFEIGVIKGFEEVRSAHIQLPVQLSYKLSKSNFDVNFFTNDFRKETSLPVELESIKVFTIPYPRKRKEKTAMYDGHSKKISIINTFKSIREVVTLAKKNNISTLHFFNGSFGVGIYCGIVSFLLKDTRVFWTPSSQLNTNSKIIKYLLSKIDLVICSTDYHKKMNNKLFDNILCIKHGIVRKIKLNSNAPKKRITFWRDPSYKNGADIAKNIFNDLANKYPEIIFTFMVRPHFDEINLKTDKKNVEVYKFPYPAGITLENILSESIVCIFPFREFSTNPQLSILESLEAGIPCICSNIESAKEYGIDKELLIEDNDLSKYSVAIEKVINEPDKYKPMKIENFGFSWENFIEEHKKLYKKEITNV